MKNKENNSIFSYVHFVIMGSGRVGSTLATTLDQQGHSVAIIDQKADAFLRLPSSFTGRRVKGVGFDRDILIQAGIEDAYAFAAVSNGDNSNIIAARIVRETFGVSNVVARIYDPERASLYRRLGIPTIAPVKWSTNAILHWMLPSNSYQEIHHQNSDEIKIFRIVPHHSWIGKTLGFIEKMLPIRIVYFTQFSRSMIPESEYVLQENDEIVISVSNDDAPRVKRILSSKLTSENSN